MSKDLFKKFVKAHPELGNSVMDGEESEVWDKYLKKSYLSTSNTTTSRSSSFSELVNMIKNVDLESVQKGVNSLQKTIGLLQDIGVGAATKEKTYEPRPMYKYFDD